MTYRLPAALTALALLAGCGEEPVAEPSDNDGRAAEGEVIGGTISDAMLPLDTVRSQGASALVATDTEAGEAASDAPTPAAQQAEPAAAEDPEPESEADEDAA
jgi:hypothetical protein